MESRTAALERAGRSAVHQFELQEKRDEIRNVLAAALTTLSYKDRMVICLMYFQECTVKQVSDELGISQVNVKVRSHRAKKKMRQYFDDLGIYMESIS